MDKKDVVVEFLSRLRALFGRPVKNFSILKISKTVILTGVVESYYHKQLINVVAQHMFVGMKITNNVKVIEPKEEKC